MTIMRSGVERSAAQRRAIFEFLKNVKVRTGMLVDYNLGMGDLILMGVQHGAPRGGR